MTFYGPDEEYFQMVVDAFAEECRLLRARAEKAEAENCHMESIVDGYVTQGSTNIEAQDMFLEEHNKVVALEAQLAEKEQELSVAYGGTGPEAQEWWSALDETRARLGAALARAEMAEAFAKWLHKWKDAEEALADQKMTALQERNAQLAEAEAAIDETLCHGPFGINRLACFDYRTKYPKEAS